MTSTGAGMSTSSAGGASRVALVEEFLGSGDFHCTFGVGATRAGKVQFLPVPGLNIVGRSRHDGKLGDLPTLQEAGLLEALYVRELPRLLRKEVEALVVIPERTPNNHVQGHNLSWAMWLSLKFACLTLSDGKSPDNSQRQREERALKQWLTKGGGYSDSETWIPATVVRPADDAILGSVMSPAYQGEIPGQRHPRWAPKFLFSTIAGSNVEATTQSHPATALSIVNRAYGAVKTPYYTGLLYVVPGYPPHGADTLAWAQIVTQQLKQWHGAQAPAIDSNELAKGLTLALRSLNRNGTIKHVGPDFTEAEMELIVAEIVRSGHASSAAGAAIIGLIRNPFGASLAQADMSGGRGSRRQGGGGGCPFSFLH